MDRSNVPIETFYSGQTRNNGILLDNIVLLHTLTGIGEYFSNGLLICRNAIANYYNVRIEEIIK